MDAEHVVVPRFPTLRELEVVAALERLAASVRPAPAIKDAVRQRVLAALTADPRRSLAS